MDAAPTLHGRAPLARLDWRVTPLRLTLALLALALALRLNGLGLRPLWLDESYSAWFSARGWHYLWTAVPTYEPHPPFYYSLLKLWRSVSGGSAVALRSFSVLLSVLTIPIVIAASNELERARPTGRPLLRAGITGFLAACAPLLVLLDEEARPYPLLIFAYALGVLAVLRLSREFGDRAAGSWRSWLMLGFAAEIALWAHGLGLIYAASLALALAPAWLKRPRSPARLVRGAATAIGVALLYLPCLAMIASRAGDWGSGWLSWRLFNLIQLIPLYSVPYEALTVGSAIAALTMILFIKRAIAGDLKERGWSADKAVLVLWWAPPLISVAVSMLAVPVFLLRGLAPSLIPAYLAIAGAVARTDQRPERNVLVVAMCAPLLVTAVQVGLRPAPEAWDEVASYLNRHVAAGEQVWLYPNDSALPLGEAGADMRTHGIPGDYPAVGIKGIYRMGSPAVVSLTPAQAGQLARNSASDQATIWLVTRQPALFDPDNDLPGALAKVRRPGRAQEWGYIKVQPYYSDAAVH